jgi:sugar phosphate isomerase/epimerase
MKLGFLTACLPQRRLTDIAAWAAANAFEALEVAAWPALGNRPFYDNNLHPDPTERKNINTHVLALIDAATLLGVPTVGTFVGRDPTRSVADNLRDAEQVFRPLVDRAGERGVNIVIENCVMEGWHPDGYPGTSALRPPGRPRAGEGHPGVPRPA